jgi:predicted O-methyltransferase YrrM
MHAFPWRVTRNIAQPWEEDAMIIKLIKARVRPGCKERFLARQRVWNDCMSRQAGFMGVYVATDPSAEDLVYLAVLMDSREALQRFMARDHNVVERETAMRELYDNLEVSVLDVIEPTSEVRLDITTSRAGSGYQISALSEIYRVSCALRTAVMTGLFDLIEDEGASLTELAERCGAKKEYITRLVQALAAVNLVGLEGGIVYPKPIGSRHLVRGRETYLGDLVLHNTRPALWHRWGRLDEELGLSHVDKSDDDANRFLRAMSDVAAAGQAAALVSAVELIGRRRMLDVGGALGDYSIAFCRVFPKLTSVVLDLPSSEELFRQKLGGSGLSERISFVGGDYRSELPTGNFDTVLLSNVLRGETVPQARALVERIYSVMAPNGLLLVQDLFTNDEPGRGPLFAALFGLHLPDGMNGSVKQVTSLLNSAGFRISDIRPLDGYVVANKVIAAEKS